MPALDRDKLAKMLGMLGSRHDGEVAAAGRSAHILVRDAGVSWTQVLSPADGAISFDRDKLAEAEAENRRLVIELAQRRLDIDSLIAKHRREIRELQGAKRREKTRELRGRQHFASIKTVIGWAAVGLAVCFIGAMIWSAQKTQEIQVFRGTVGGHGSRPAAPASAAVHAGKGLTPER
jgi:hypothetical protein